MNKDKDKDRGFLLDAEQIGEFIKTRRREFRLTQTYMSQRTHISQSQLSKIETGRAEVNLSELEKILGVLSVEISYREKK